MKSGQHKKNRTPQGKSPERSFLPKKSTASSESPSNDKIAFFHSPGTFTSAKIHYTLAKALTLHFADKPNMIVEEFEGPAADQSYMKGIVGHGISHNLRKFREKMIRLAQEHKDEPIAKIIIVGHSRGALQAIQMSHIAAKHMPNCSVELYLKDPVLGKIDRIGVSKKWWQRKFELGASVSKCVISYSVSENNYLYHGVVPPDQFIIPERAAFLSYATDLTHSTISSDYYEVEFFYTLKSQEAKQLQIQRSSENQKKRDAIGALCEIEMGVRETLTEEEQYHLRAFFSEDFARSNQRASYQFYRHQHLKQFSPVVQNLILETEKNAAKAITALSDLVFLKPKIDDPVAIIKLREKLHQDKNISKIVAILNTKRTPSIEKYHQINKLCHDDENTHNTLIGSIQEILQNPTAISSTNCLKQLSVLVSDYKREYRNIAEEKKRRLASAAQETKLAMLSEKITSFSETLKMSSENYLLTKLITHAKKILTRGSDQTPSPSSSWDKLVLSSYSQDSLTELSATQSSRHSHHRKSSR